MTTIAVKGTIAAATAKAQNVEYFAADLAPNTISPSKFRVTVSGTAVGLQVTLDSGTTWVKLNGGSALTANALTTFDFMTRPGDTVNFRTPDAAGITLDVFRVDEIIGSQ